LAELAAWDEGEARRRGLTPVDRHILACPRCRFEAGRIRKLLESYSRLAVAQEPPPVEQGVERFLSILRNQVLFTAARKRFRRERDFRLLARLKPYFGCYPMSLLDLSPGEGPAFPAEIARLAEAFLGRRAAAAMIDLAEEETKTAAT